MEWDARGSQFLCVGKTVPEHPQSSGVAERRPRVTRGEPNKSLIVTQERISNEICLPLDLSTRPLMMYQMMYQLIPKPYAVLSNK
jgi:hypothetical protein